MTAVGWNDEDGCTGPCCTTVVLAPVLPLHTRIRLRLVHRVDQARARLVERGHMRAAEWLWRACGMW